MDSDDDHSPAADNNSEHADLITVKRRDDAPPLPRQTSSQDNMSSRNPAHKSSIRDRRRSLPSFDNLVALANYEDTIRRRAVRVRKSIWRDRGEPAKELYDIRDVLIHALKGGLRAFAIGFWIRAGVNLVLALVRLRKTKKEHRFELLRLAMFGSDSWSSAAMLGSFASVYKFLINSLPILFPTASIPRTSYLTLDRSAATTPNVHSGSQTPLLQGVGSMSKLKESGEETVATANATVEDEPQGKLSLSAEAHQVWIRKKTRRWQAILAGFVAGSVGIQFEKKQRRLGVAQQMFVRGLQGCWGSLSTRHEWNVPHGDVAVFSLCCAYIMYAYLLAPDRLGRGYNSWIQQASRLAKEPPVIHRDLVRTGRFDISKLDNVLKRDGITPNNALQLADIRRKAMAAIPDFGPAYCQCPIAHPGIDGCIPTVVDRFFDVARWMLPVYGALTLLPMMIFKPKVFVKTPMSSLVRVASGTLRSSAFLGAFVAYYQAFFCFKHWLHSICVDKWWMPAALSKLLISKPSYWLGGAVAGLSLFIEKPSRRPELAMYVLPKGLETMWITARSHGWAMKTSNWGDVVLTGAGMGMVMHTYQNNPAHLSGFVRRIMYQVVGPN